MFYIHWFDISQFFEIPFFLMLNACDINLTEFIASLKINCALYNHPQQELALADAWALFSVIVNGIKH